MDENTMNEDFLLIYKKNSMMSFYLSKILGVQGDYVRKGIINRDIVVDKIGEYNVLYGMNTNLDEITKLLVNEIGFSIMEMMDEQEIKDSKEIGNNLQPDLNTL